MTGKTFLLTHTCITYIQLLFCHDNPEGLYNMKQIQHSIIIFIHLISFFCLSDLKSVAVQYDSFVDSQILETRKDIITLRLVNNLHLNNNQMKQYLQTLKKLKTIERTERDKNLAEIYSKQNIILQRYKNELARNNTYISSYEKVAKDLDEKIKVTIINSNKKLQVLENELKVMLTDNQEMIISSYIPCLVPPEDIKDPTRIGQAESNDDLKAGLTEIRKVPWPVYMVFREIWINKYFEFYNSHLKEMNGKEKSLEKQRLFKVFDDAQGFK